jgi:hypothetical protein
MTRTYRFVRLDPQMRPRDEINLVCANPEDALLLASSLGQRVEVWDGASRIGLVDSTASAAEPEPGQQPAPASPGAAFNPFRPGVLRSLRGKT